MNGKEITGTMKRGSMRTQIGYELVYFLINAVLISLLFVGYFTVREYFNAKDESYALILTLLFSILLSKIVYSSWDTYKKIINNTFRSKIAQVNSKYLDLEESIKNEIDEMRSRQVAPEVVQQFELKYLNLKRRKLEEIEKLVEVNR